MNILRLLLLLTLTQLTFGKFIHKDGPYIIGNRVTPHASAMFQVETTTKGYLIPRLTTIQMNAIASPAEGLQVYNTDTNSLQVFAGGAWATIGGGGSDHPLWDVNTGYGIGAIIVEGSTFKVYRCNFAHTSDAALFATDLALGYWDELSDDINRLTAGSVIDETLMRWDGTTGDDVQSSNVVISDTDAMSGITQLDVDNVQIDGNSIVASDLNGDLTLNGDGTGGVLVTTDLSVDNINIDLNSIISTDVNGDINLDANGTGNTVIPDGLFTSSEIVTPVRSDVKQDTEANLTTYAATAANGQMCFATDTKKMYQIIDGELKAVGGGGLGSTGVQTGGILGFVDGTHFSVTDGAGLVVDYSVDPTDPVITEVAWSGNTNVLVTNLGQAVTYVAIDDTGAVIQQNLPYNHTEERDNILIGVIIHPSGAIVAANALTETHVSLTSPLNQLLDLSHAIGMINEEGNVYEATAASDLKIKKNAGKLYKFGSNVSVSIKDPSHVDQAAADPVTFIAYYDNGAGSPTTEAPTTDITPGSYDDGDGTLGSVATNQWSVKRVYMAIDGSTFIAYGREVYNSKNSARQSFLSEDVFFPSELVNVVLRGYLFARGGAGDLNLEADALFIPADKFGEGVSGGATGADNTLQSIYDNSPSGDMVLSTSVGTRAVLDNSTPIATTLFQVADNAAAVKYLDVDAERVSITDADGTHIARKESELRLFDEFKVATPSSIYTEAGLTNAVVNETTTPIDGHQSGKFTVTTGDGTGTITRDAITSLAKKDYQLLGIHFDWLYDGNAGDVSLKIEESTDGISYTDLAEISLPKATEATLAKLNFKLSSTSVTHYRYLFYINVAVNGAVAEWDNVKVITDPLPTIESVISESYRASDSLGMSSSNTAIPYFGTVTENTLSGLGTITNDSTNGLIFTATAKCNVVITHRNEFTTATFFGVSKNPTATEMDNPIQNLSEEKAVATATQDTASQGQSTTYSGPMDVGDTLVVHAIAGRAFSTNAAMQGVSITATASSANVIFSDGHSDVDSMVRLHTGNGYGSINTAIRRWLTQVGTTLGTAITYTDSATDGASFTVNESGTYAISYTDNFSTAAMLGLTLNSTQLTASIHTINTDDRLSVQITGGASFEGEASWQGYLNKGDIVRCHTNKISAGTENRSIFTMSKIAVNPIYSVPVTNEVENVYSARIANNGTATITSESAPFIESVTRTALGKVDIVFKSGFFAVTPAMEIEAEIPSDVTGVSTATVAPTSSGVEVHIKNDGIAFFDKDFSIVVQRQGADYKAPKGYFLRNMAPIQVVKYKHAAANVASIAGTKVLPLDTVEGDSFSSLNSNQITLPAGKYVFRGSLATIQSNTVYSTIYNVTDSVIVDYGSYAFSGSAAAYAVSSSIMNSKPVTFHKETVIEYRATATAAFATGYSRASSPADDNNIILVIEKHR